MNVRDLMLKLSKLPLDLVPYLYDPTDGHVYPFSNAEVEEIDAEEGLVEAVVLR